MLDSLLSLVAPHQCVRCGAEGSVLCASCGFSTPTLPSICYACGRATKNGQPCNEHARASGPNAVFIRSAYGGDIKKLLYEYKFAFKRSAAQDIARLLNESLPYYARKPLVVYVPSTGGHARWRGFDHVARIAKFVARERVWPLAGPIIKLKNVNRVGANRSERKAQLKDAFAVVGPSTIKSQHILLIDDVVTTGATIEACTSLLKKAGAQTVDVAVLAKTL